MPDLVFVHASLVLPNEVIEGGLRVRDGLIAELGPAVKANSGDTIIDVGGDYLMPGFVDLHIHGGAGHDFMDGTDEAFLGVCRAHAKHGTTSVLATTTVASHEQHLRFFECCRRWKEKDTGGARILGAHFYGPYFAPEAKGCHPGGHVRPPNETEFADYLAFADCLVRATVAPELEGAEAFVRACRQRGIRCNAGHSYATFDQMRAAIEWGVTHVDHLFCAMSDRARLRQSQTYPMRGGVMEATLYFDELTTEIIADGKHLSPELLKLAYKVKGPDRLALCTDANRALDMPDGPYIFGPKEDGEPILKQDGVGLMPDAKSLASGVVGLDHAVKTMVHQAGIPLVEAVRMASLTPARIAGWDDRIGSLEVGKLADLVVMCRAYQVRRTYVGGAEVEAHR
ncbi:MAG: N-acetylglucosamine-6-phosphate deacetylase [Gemmataceae bacterium]|nr:N-acetylglucosamine-6-phosphate deacetylase [Gemmataceae bacterium]